MDAPSEVRTLAKELINGMDRRLLHVVRVITEAENFASTIFDDYT
jgi:hypothetical protein